MDLWVFSGLLVTLLGIACGGVALRRTWTEHGTGSLLPDARAAGQRAVNLAGRVLPRLRRRQVASSDALLVLASELSATGTATVRVSPREGATADELIAHLFRRVERLENVSDEDRAAANAVSEDLRKELTAVAERVSDESLRLETLTKSVAVGTVRLQLVGLILVGIGTALMSIPSLFT